MMETKIPKKPLQSFKSGKLSVLVTTGLLAYGIDIAFLPYMINDELPCSPKDFVHRIGRTGKAENPGKAISLVSTEEEHHFGVIQKKMKKSVKIIEANVAKKILDDEIRNKTKSQ